MWLSLSCIQCTMDMNVKMCGLIIKYEVYGHDAITFEVLLELVFEFEYDL